MINLSYLNRRILHDVFKVVKRRTSSSAVISLFNAGDRDFDITMVDKYADIDPGKLITDVI